MRRRSDRDARVKVACAALVALAGCARSSCSPGDEEGGSPPADTRTSSVTRERVLVLGTTQEPDTLDPVFTEIAGAQEILALLFRDLTTYDDRWQLQLSLAAAPPIVETTTSGGERVRWTLRPDLRWSDGRPVLASDVAFGHRVASDPSYGAIKGISASAVERIEVSSARELAVVWRRRGVDHDLPRVHPILPEHAYPKPAPGVPFRGMGDRPISNGPYRVSRWIRGQQLELEVSPTWSGERPGFDRIVFRFMKSEDSFEPELVTGGIDALGEASGLTLERAKGLAARLRPTHAVELTDSGVWLHLLVRLDDPRLGDVAARRAISRAIDRRALAELAYGGEATPAGGFLPPRHPASSSAAADLLDLEAAERFAKEAFGSTKAPIKLQLASGTQASERAAAYVQSQLAKIGVAIELEALPLRVLFEKMRKKEHAPLVLYAWRVSPDWDGRTVFRSDGAQNYGAVRDAELDRLLDEVAASSSRAEWTSRLRAVERRVVERLIAIPLVFRRSASVRPHWLDGWRPTGTTSPVTWNAERWRHR